MTDKIPTLGAVAVLNEDDIRTTGTAKVVDLKPKRKRATANEMAAREVLDAVAAELLAQDAKWGEQNHPLQGGIYPARSQEYWVKQADGWKRVNAKRVKDGVLGWDSILIEEVSEALAESDTDKACAELVQVAAVAVNAILSLRRNSKDAA